MIIYESLFRNHLFSSPPLHNGANMPIHIAGIYYNVFLFSSISKHFQSTYYHLIMLYSFILFKLRHIITYMYSFCFIRYLAIHISNCANMIFC